jgi:hypothetical protein
MAAPQFSPGVQIREIDLTTTTNPQQDNVGVVVGPFARGPINDPTTISTERQLVETFGKPTKDNYEYWYAAASFLQYGGVCRVIRSDNSNIFNAANALGSGATATASIDGGAIDAVTITNAGTGYSNAIATIVPDGANAGSGAQLSVTIEEGAITAITVTAGGSGYTGSPTVQIRAYGPKVRNESDYESSVESGTNIYQWAAKDAGELSNSLRVYITDAGADQVLTLSQPAASAQEPEFVKGEAVAVSGEDKDGKVYSYVVEFKLAATNLLSGFAVGDTVNYTDGSNTASGKVAYWSRATRTLQLTGVSGIAIPTTGVLFVGASAAAATSKGTVSTIKRKLSIILDSGSQLFQKEDDIDDTNSTSYNIAIAKAAYGESEIYPGLPWVTLAQRPGTSPFVTDRGGSNDEIHIAVFDGDGKISGQPNTLLEKFLYVSKASNAKGLEGQNNYYKDVVNARSEYIWWGAHPDSADLYDVNSAVSGVWGQEANTNFDIVRRDISTAANGLTAGTTNGWTSYNYDFEGGYQDYTATLGDLTQSYDLVSDPETEDVDFIIMGPSLGTDTAAKAAHIISIVNSRKDCLAFVSAPKEDVVNISNTDTVTENLTEFFDQLQSSSYTIFDSGYKYTYDKYNDTYRWVACNADIAGLCVETSITNESWYSPAGFSRGRIRNIVKLAYNPRKAQRDLLYASRINPIVTFPGEGTVLFGDKTAQGFASAFDRINVRRLFLQLESIIGAAAKTQLFELNDEATRSTFINLVEPYLRDVEGKRGITEFLVVCDERNNPADAIDRGEFYAEIYVKPTRTINYITLSFVATRTGVSFSEVIS